MQDPVQAWWHVVRPGGRAIIPLQVFTLDQAPEEEEEEEEAGNDSQKKRGNEKSLSGNRKTQTRKLESGEAAEQKLRFKASSATYGRFI